MHLQSATFPFELAYHLVCMHSVWGDTVLDPLAGTGTAAAASAAGRNAVGGAGLFARLVNEHPPGRAPEICYGMGAPPSPQLPRRGGVLSPGQVVSCASSSAAGPRGWFCRSWRAEKGAN